MRIEQGDITYKDLGYDKNLARPVLSREYETNWDGAPADVWGVYHLNVLLNPSSDIIFTADDGDTISWEACTLFLADGREFSIDAGNTGDMTSTTYIYFDLEKVPTLQTTTVAGNFAGENKILLAKVPSGTSSSVIVLI